MAERSQKIELRRNRILQTLRREGVVSVSRLSLDLGATPVTIRSDLAALEQEGYLLRVQGGAVQPREQNPGTTQPETLAYAEEKYAIAAAVAARVRDGDTLFINCGTTSVCVARALKQRKNLSVVTNSLAVATELGSFPTFRVLLLGGVVNARYGYTYGSDAQDQLSQYQADWAILSVDGVSPKGGITTYHAEEAILDRMMMDGAKKILITADRSKIGRTGFTRVRDCAPGLWVVTDSHDPVLRSELTELGIQFLPLA